MSFIKLSTDFDGVLLVVGELQPESEARRLGVLAGAAGDFAKYLKRVFPPGLADKLFRLDIMESQNPVSRPTRAPNINEAGFEFRFYSGSIQVVIKTTYKSIIGFRREKIRKTVVLF